MNILILEDTGASCWQMSDYLTSKGYQVFQASSPEEGNSILSEHRIDFLIVDLNLDPTGLTFDQTEETDFGLLTGAVWLHRQVLPKHPRLRHRTVLYSGYLDKYFGTPLEEQLHGIPVVSKGDTSSGARRILLNLNKTKRLGID